MPRRVVRKEKLQTIAEKPKEEKIVETVSDPTEEEKSPVLEQVNKQEQPSTDTDAGEKKPSLEDRVARLETNLAQITEILAQMTDVLADLKGATVAGREPNKAVAEVTGEVPALGKSRVRRKGLSTRLNIRKRRDGIMKARETPILKVRIRKAERKIDKTVSIVRELVDIIESLAKENLSLRKKIEKLEKEIEKLRKDIVVEVETTETGEEKATVEAKPKEKPTVEVPAPEASEIVASKAVAKAAVTPRPDVDANPVESLGTDNRLEIIRKILSGKAKSADIYREVARQVNA